MAGSLTTFAYVADNGSRYLITADKSNMLAVNGTAANPTAADFTANIGIPRNITPRFVRYVGVGGARTLKIYCATTAIYNAPPATIPDPIAGTGNLTLATGQAERRRVYRQIDTGLTA